MAAGPNRTSEPEAQDHAYWAVFAAVSDGLIIHDLETLRIVEANTAAATMHGYSRQEFIGLHLSDYLHADSQPVFTQSARALAAGGVLEAPAIHLRRDGSAFHVEVRRTAFLFRSRPCLLSVVRDVSKRIQAEELHERREQGRQREQATLLDISQTLASTLELKPETILDQLGALVQYSRAVLFVKTDSGLEAVAVRGLPQTEGEASIQIPTEDPGVLVQLFNEHRPIRIPDVWGSDEPAVRMRAALADGASTLLEGVRSWMWVAVVAKGRVMGGIGLGQELPDFFSKHDADLALTVANQAAIAMINAELYANARELAVLEERQRLARNLHDAVNQSLFSAGLIAEVLPRLWERDQPEARRSLQDLRRLIRGALAELRALLAELRPATLVEAELGDLLRLLANGFTGRTNVPAKVTMAGEARLPGQVQVAFYRICQEALNNIGKHAGASNVEIEARYDGSTMELSIRDDGVGFDPGQIGPGHYGLNMMRERVDAVGAALAVASQPGQGTVLTVRWTRAEKEETS